ncbi:MAG: hypothetical protein AAF726_02930 [Planctomycetota bacterium]
MSRAAKIHTFAATLLAIGCNSQPRDVDPGDPWEPQFRVPFGIAYADFSLGDGAALDSLTAVSAVPTIDLPVPLSKDWTLTPFMGAGAGLLVDEGLGVWIVSSGVRAEWLRRVGDHLLLRFQPRIRYDINVNRRDNLLGDWGRTDISAEIRYAPDADRSRIRFEPGLYAQAFWYFDDIDFDIPAVTPESVDNQIEIGFSLGTREPVRVFGIRIPRVYLGYRFGGGVEVTEIRFGDL